MNSEPSSTTAAGMASEPTSKRGRVTCRLIGRLMITALLAFPSTPTWALDDVDVTRQGRALAVSWIAKNPVDVSVAGEPDATPKAAKPVAHATRNGRFTLSEAGPARRSFLLREVGQKTVI